MRTLILDIETESLTPSHIWCVCTLDVDTGEKEEFLNVTSVPEEKERLRGYLLNSDRIVLHNGIGFDVPVLSRLTGIPIDRDKVLDTLVISRLKDYGIEGGHSLKKWGERLGFPKDNFKAFDTLTQEMIDYCHQDVLVTYELYKKLLVFINDRTQAVAIKCEHDIQWLCEEMTCNGFSFKEDEAEEMLGGILDKMYELEDGFQEDFPPKLQEVHTLMYRTKADGTLWTSVKNARKKYPINTVKDGRLLCYDYVPFKPSSPNQRIDRLWEAGWQPTDKTKGHIEYERSLQRY